GRGSIMCEALAQGLASRIDDVARCIEIGLADFKMNNIAAFCLERFRFHQHFERGLRAESRHAPGEPEFMCLIHDVRSALYRTGATCLLRQDWQEPATCDFSRVMSGRTRLVAVPLGRRASSRKIASRVTAFPPR